ncbi:MAG TPA: carboxypeptidase-like regulatory domain-containing protein, partial [Vicinamibacterales bacterium]|nr:carboxypeptidase-like regulatory domain-containing protein [Vicinamibacterales bacterium]
MRSLIRLAWLACAIAIVTAPSATWAQSAGATLQGTVHDQQSGVLPGATVAITNTETGWVRTVVTDERGWYRATALPPGPYEVRVELQGFVTQRRSGLTLTVGQE